MKIKVGIFFGGPSREREISFAGGRTVYDNLNKTIFEPVPIFVDSHRNFIQLDWKYIYKESIRDFYPPKKALPPSPNAFQIYVESLGKLDANKAQTVFEAVGQKITPEELPNLINIAFLALQGEYGEDGQLQAELEALKIPYTGSGVRACQIGMDKALQKELMAEQDFNCPQATIVSKKDWQSADAETLYQSAKKNIGFPMLIRPANQGSSIGMSTIEKKSGLDGFVDVMNGAFFRQQLQLDHWNKMSEQEKVEFVRQLSDIRKGLGFPMNLIDGEEKRVLSHPEALLSTLDEKSKYANADSILTLEAHQSEEKVILEESIHGKEFSCIVIRKEDGSVVALTPTEITKGKEALDKLSTKLKPIDLPENQINAIRKECERLFVGLGFQTYARIDGFITEEEKIFLNDLNTTSGILSSSFLFHQAAEIGLNPSQALSYIIRISLQERIAEQADVAAYKTLLQHLDDLLLSLSKSENEQQKIGVILGGYSFERHISVASGRNIFKKLSSSDKYEALPFFLTGKEGDSEMYQLPLNLLLEDNADDIRDKILSYEPHPVIQEIKTLCEDITQKYASKGVVFAPEKVGFYGLKAMVDGVFIALLGRPGEDGQLQEKLEEHEIPYNGSGIAASQLTINKFETLQTLKKEGFSVTDQLLQSKTVYDLDSEEFFQRIESRFNYPLIAKPVDDGCSAAVKVINNRTQLEAYTRLMFRPKNRKGAEARKVLQIDKKEEFPRKEEILFERLVNGNGAAHFLEITGALLTHLGSDGTITYEVFEPSEVLKADGEQNITPARFADNRADYEYIASQVKAELEKAARVLNVQGYAQIDAFVRIDEQKKAEIIIIEVNSLPAMTPATSIFHQAALNNYQPHEIIDQILEFGFKKESTPVVATTPPVAEPTPEEIEEPSSDPVVTIQKEEEVPATEVEEETSEETVQTPPVASTPYDPPKTSNEKPQQDNPIVNRLKEWANKVWTFLKTPIFLRNFLGLLGAMLFLFMLVSLWLGVYTRHGESRQVGNYVGMDLDEAKRKAKSSSFSVVVSDSIFLVDRSPNVVLEQDPKPFSNVKEKRRIYLVVTKSTADEVTLPGLVGNYNFDQYTRQLRRMDIKFTIKERVFDAVEEENSIKYFFYNGKKITQDDLAEGVDVPKGSLLEFVVTERSSNRVTIPNLVCTRYEAATFLISSLNLNLGTVHGRVSDNAWVWKQDPPYTSGAQINMGAQIDIYLTDERPSGCSEDTDPSDLDFEEDQEDFN
jgi:D-alanine-D-alanine ligase